LQVSSDSQIQKAAREWTALKLVDQCLMALAQSNPRQTIIFKLHPLELSNKKIKRIISERAQALGIDQTRYKILHTGRIGDLTAHSSGMVVINSTSAFSALHHGVPLLVLGDAIYRHEEITTIGTSQNDILNFFQFRRAKSFEKVAAFLEAVKSQSLLPGDFYMSAGRKEAIKNIVLKLNNIPVAGWVAQEVIT
jgi:capsular polysaccharide export protein